MANNQHITNVIPFASVATFKRTGALPSPSLAESIAAMPEFPAKPAPELGNDAHIIAWEKRLNAIDAYHNSDRGPLNTDEVGDYLGSLRDQCCDMIAEHAAYSPTAMLVKLRMIAEGIAGGMTSCDEHAVLTLTADLERLESGAS